jgi:HSP20 family protein
LAVRLDQICPNQAYKHKEQKEEDETYFRVERSYGYFNRTIQLPAEVNPDKVDATYKRGILKINLRKSKENETICYQIAIEYFEPGQ